MYDMPRAATVTAATAVKVLSLSRDDIFSCVSPESLEKMRAMTRIQLMQTTPVLAKLSHEHRLTILKHMFTEKILAGREIMRAGWRTGDANRKMYIIEEGTCSQKREGLAETNEVLFPGTNFGNLELAFGCPQQSTVVAQTDMSVVSISYSKILEVLGDEAQIAMKVMQRTMHLKLLREAHTKLLHQNDLTLASVLDQGSFRHFKAWQPIIRKGDEVSHLMMLDQGICIEHDDDISTMMESTVAFAQSTEHSQPGDTFGMESVVDQKGATSAYTLIAICDTSVLYLPAEAIATLPEISSRLKAIQRFRTSKLDCCDLVRADSKESCLT